MLFWKVKTTGSTSFFGKKVGVYLNSKWNITTVMAYSTEVWGHGLLPYCKYDKFLIQHWTDQFEGTTMKSIFGINPYQFSSTHRPFVFSREELALYKYWLKSNWKDFSSGPVVMYTPCNAEDMGLIPGQGTKIPHAAEQLSLCAATTEPLHCK